MATQVINTQVNVNTSQASQSIGQLRNQFSSLNSTVSQTNTATQAASTALNNVGQNAGRLASGVGAANAAVNLFSGSSGALQSSLSGVNQILSVVSGGVGGFFNLLRANPIGLVVTVLGTLVTVMSAFSSSTREASLAQQQLSDAMDEGAKAAVEEQTRLALLVQIAGDATLAVEQRTRAIEELQKKYPQYFSDLTLENSLTDKLTVSYNRATNAILAKAQATAAFNKIVENNTEILELQNKLEERQAELGERASRMGTFRGLFDNTLTTGSIGQEVNRLRAAIEELQNSNLKLAESYIKLDASGAPFGGSGTSNARVAGATRQVQNQQNLVEEFIKAVTLYGKATNVADEAITKGIEETLRSRQGISQRIQNLTNDFNRRFTTLVDNVLQDNINRGNNITREQVIRSLEATEEVQRARANIAQTLAAANRASSLIINERNIKNIEDYTNALVRFNSTREALLAATAGDEEKLSERATEYKNRIDELTVVIDNYEKGVASMKKVLDDIAKRGGLTLPENILNLGDPIALNDTESVIANLREQLQGLQGQLDQQIEFDKLVARVQEVRDIMESELIPMIYEGTITLDQANTLILESYIASTKEILKLESLTAEQRLAIQRDLYSQMEALRARNYAKDLLILRTTNAENIKVLNEQYGEALDNEGFFNYGLLKQAEYNQSLESEQIQSLERQIAIAELYGESTVELEKQLAEARVAIARREADAKLIAIGLVGNALQSAAQIAGESTVLGKALAIASTTISTYQSAQQAYASQFLPVPTPDSPVRGAIAAGAAILAGLANVKQILSVKIPDTGAGTGSGISGSTPVYNAPQVSTGAIPTRLDEQSVNQIIQQQNQNSPIRAYVLESDVTDAQGRAYRYRNSSSLGG